MGRSLGTSADATNELNDTVKELRAAIDKHAEDSSTLGERMRFLGLAQFVLAAAMFVLAIAQLGKCV